MALSLQGCQGVVRVDRAGHADGDPNCFAATRRRPPTMRWAMALTHRILVLLVVCLASRTDGSLIGPRPPLAELVAESDRIVLAQVLGQERFDDGKYRYTRTHLQVVWDMTHAAGHESGLGNLEAGISVVGWTGVVEGFLSGMTGAAFFVEGETVVVCLQRLRPRTEGVPYAPLTGEWSVSYGLYGRRGFNQRIFLWDGPPVVEPMHEDQWDSLVDYSVELLTLLGMGSSRAESQALEALLPVRPSGGTTVDAATWGCVKAHVSSP